MKKFGVIIAIIAIAFAGCVTTGGGGGAAGGEAPYIVDLSKMKQVSTTSSPDKIGSVIPGLRNPTAITRNWADVMYLFPEDMRDVTGFTRVTVTVKYYNAQGVELLPKDSMGMASMLYDVNANWRADSGGNTVFKEFNVGGFSGMLHKDRGVRIGLSKNPQALLVQRAQDAAAAFIELTSVVFHNGNYTSGSEVAGEGPEGTQ